MIEQNGNLKIGLTLQMSVGYSSDVPRISCTQTDNKSITVAVRMMDKNEPYLVPDRSEVNLRAKKPDGKAVYCPLTRDENGFSFELGGQLTTAVGVVQAAVEVISGDFVLSSAQFEIEVKPRSTDDNDIISDDDITTLFNRIDSQVVQSVADYFTENPVKDGENGPQGEAGFGVVAMVNLESTSEESFLSNAEYGRLVQFAGTEEVRAGCRIGDIFAVTSTPKDTGNAHVLWYRSATDSGNLSGILIGHTVASRGEKGDTGDTGPQGIQGEKGDKGDTGAAGVGIEEVAQNTVSAEDGGENLVTLYLSNGQRYSFTVKNGSKGDKGDRGDAGGAFTETVTEVEMSIPARSSASDYSSASVDYTPVYEDSIICIDVVSCHYDELGDLYGFPVVFQVLPKYANSQKVQGVKSITAIRMGTTVGKIDITLKVHEIKC